MYQVTAAFLYTAKSPIQEHKITGTIGSVSFDEANIVEGSFSISNQSTDTNDVVLGSCYVGQLTAEFVGINIAYGKWINKTITLSFGLKVGEYYEYVPLGVFKIKEAKHTDHGVQVTAYDNMIKFDKKFKKSHYMNLAGMTNIIDQLCTDAGVVCGMSHAQIEALPNGDRTGINIYGSKGKKAEFANDITTLRDLLFWVAQTLGCFATMNRAGQLEFRQYKQTVVDRITEQHRIAGATFADYITHYVGIYVENLDDNTEDYYGYDSTALQQELTETMGEITQDQEDITDLEADRAEWVQKLANHECTQEEYDAAIAEIDAQEKALTQEINQLSKRAEWLSNAIAQSADDGSDMVLGANPLVMAKNLTTRDQQRREILGALSNISYTPFQASVVCGCIYDLGDVIQFSGGLYNSDTDSFGCVMSYTYTHNGGTELEGFGVDPSVVVIRNKTQKSVDRSSRNSVDATHNQVGAADPNGSGGGGGGVDAVPGKSGDFYIRTKGSINEEPLQMAYSHTVETAGHPCSIYDFSGNNASGYTFYITGIPDGADHGEHAYFDLQGLEDTGQYHLEFDAQYTQAYAWGEIGYQDYADINGTTIATFPSDRSEHHYSVDFTYHTGDVLNFRFYRVSDNNTYIFKVSNFEITTIDANANGISYYGDDGKWHNIDYVKEVTQTQTSGTEIAEVVNSDGSTTKIYQKDGGLVDDVKVDNVSVVTNKIANINTMTGATSQADGAKGLVPTPTMADAEKYLKGDGTWAEVQGGGGENILVPTPFIYSEDEQQVGIWTDGKPLYQKTINFGALPNNTAKSVAHGISNIDKIVDISGETTNPSNNVTLALQYGYPNVNGKMITSINADRTNLTLITGDNLTGYTYTYLTIQYTKTTDTAWQGGFKAYGFTPIIYSETEREIGVWIDGKPLYQKSFKLQNITVQANSFRLFHISDYISDIDQYVCMQCVTTSPAPDKVVLPLLYANSAYTQYNLWYGNYGDDLYISRGSGSTVTLDFEITLQYTKTTDVAGSGKYAELGVPAVHYDDTERVIGTWFGETLYQKTIEYSSNFVYDGSFANRVDVSALNIENLVNGFGFYNRAGHTQLQYPFGGGVRPEGQATYSVSSRLYNGNLEFAISSNYSDINKICFTIQYTKTTD